MAQARTDYGKVAAPSPFTGTGITPSRIDVFKFIMVCMILFTIVSVFHVWSRCKLIELNLQASDASRRLKEAELEQKRLNLEVTSLKAPGRVENIAKTDLGLGLPSEHQVIIVK